MGVRLRGWEFGLRGWEFGLRGWEFGLRDWEFGLRDWEFGLRDWEFGLKAQKPLAQGNALGNVIAINRPERAKALFTAAIMLLPFQGVLLPMHTKPRVSLRSALGYVLAALSGRFF